MDSGATVNGKKPIPTATVEKFGTAGSSKPSMPQASQVAAMGAGPGDGGGKHIANPGESTPPLAGPKEAAEVINTGTTAEEQRARLASRMYPSSNGVRQYSGAL